MELINVVYKAIDDRLGEDIVVIDVSKVNPFSDYMVVCSADTGRQAMAIVENIKQEAISNGYDLRVVEGDADSGWVLIDLYDVIVHVFTPKERLNYNLENLWLDQPRVKIEL